MIDSQSSLAIIGAGQLGSRHLQALALLGGGHNIYVVDPSEDSLKLAKARFNETAPHSMHRLQFTNKIDSLPKSINVAIVATNSGQRRAVLEYLLKQHSIEHFIIEKVLFPNLKDYSWAQSQFENRSAYVNCPQRTMAWADILKEKFAGSKFLHMRASGSALGLGCNSIHYLDLYNWLTGANQYTVNTALLGSDIDTSKRPGYFEIYGQLDFLFAGHGTLSLHSLREPDIPTSIEFLSDSSRITMTYTQGPKGLFITTESKSNWEISQAPFELTVQSKMTNKIVERLLTKGTCGLSTLLNSIALHRPLVGALSEYFRAHRIDGDFDCPIT